MSSWQVRDAGPRLSELIARARTEGPQTIGAEGRDEVVVLSIEDYRALSKERPDFIAYLLGAPKVEDFEAPRDRDTGRPVDL